MGRRSKYDQYDKEKEESYLNQTIAANIRKEMENYGNSKKTKITQDALAKAMEEKTGFSYSRSLIKHWINNTSSISIFDAVVLCNVLDCSLDKLCHIRKVDYDNEAAEDYTGLSPKVIHYLHELDPEKREVLNLILNEETTLDFILESILKARKEYSVNLKNAEVELVNEIEGNASNKRLADCFSSIELPFLRQIRYKQDILKVFSYIIGDLIPDAISKEHPHPEYERERLLNDHIDCS